MFEVIKILNSRFCYDICLTKYKDKQHLTACCVIYTYNGLHL
jgi:hypothetical protein